MAQMIVDIAAENRLLRLGAVSLRTPNFPLVAPNAAPLVEALGGRMVPIRDSGIPQQTSDTLPQG